MDLGTAKPTRAERAEVSYHLLDLVEPSEEFTVAQYQRGRARRGRRRLARRSQGALRRRHRSLRPRRAGRPRDTRSVPTRSRAPRSARARRACRRSTPNSKCSTRWRPVAWRRPTRVASCARSRSRSAPVGRSPPTARASSPTVPRASSRWRCRVTSSSWTCASPARFRTWMDQGLLEEVTCARERAGGPQPHGAPGRGIPRTVATRRRGRRSRGLRRGRDHPEPTAGPSTAFVVLARPAHRVVRRPRRGPQRACSTC